MTLQSVQLNVSGQNICFYFMLGRYLGAEGLVSTAQMLIDVKSIGRTRTLSHDLWGDACV